MAQTTYLVLMLIWLAFEAALGAVHLANNPSRSLKQAAGRVLHTGLRTLMLVLTLLQLGGCGGGDCDEDCLRDHGPVDCKAQPEACR